MWLLLAAIAISGTVATLTDWLFMGVMYHSAYLKYPEVWWRIGGSSRREIMWSSILGYTMSAGVVGLCVLANANSIPAGLTVAALTWLAGPLVILVVNGLFIKIDPRVTFAHCIGWFARMALAGISAGLVLGPLHAIA